MAILLLISSISIIFLLNKSSISFNKYIGIGIILPFSLFTKGIEKITLGKAYTLSLSEPMTAWLLSALLLGERLSLIGSLGVLILFSGIITLACDNSK